jgi:hypothetical protein
VGRCECVFTELACPFYRRRGSDGEWMYAGCLLGLNKGGGPWVPSCAKMKICRMSVPIYLAGVSCFTSLHQRTLLGASCLEIVGSDEIPSCTPIFLSDRLVLESVMKLCWMIPSCGTISHSMVKSVSGEYHGS